MSDPTPPSPTQHPGQAVDLDAIRRRVEAATPGPWTAHDDGLVWPERMGDPVSGSTEMADAEFIARARADVPALLAALEEARRERDELRRKLDLPCGECHPCTEWAAETWKQAGLPLPHLITWQDKLAEIERMRLVVEAAKAWRASGGRSITRLARAVDTYETQTGDGA